MNSGVRARNLSKHPSPKKSESASIRGTLAHEHESAISRVNLLVSFSVWAELVWQFRLEVTNIVNQSSNRVHDKNHIQP